MPGIITRLLQRWAEAHMADKLREANLENQRLEGQVKIQGDQIKRLLDWQQRETQRLERETAIFTAEKEAALERLASAFVHAASSD